MCQKYIQHKEKKTRLLLIYKGSAINGQGNTRSNSSCASLEAERYQEGGLLRKHSYLPIRHNVKHRSFSLAVAVSKNNTISIAQTSLGHNTQEKGTPFHAHSPYVSRQNAIFSIIYIFKIITQIFTLYYYLGVTLWMHGHQFHPLNYTKHPLLLWVEQGRRANRTD